MIPDLAVVTCVSSNYLSYARALIRSIRAADADVPIFVLVIDGDGRDYLSQQNVVCISGYQLGIENWKRFAFQYTAFELSCALKPFALRNILDRGIEHVVYVDSDVYFKGSPRLILQEFAHGDVILSPHILSPLPTDGLMPCEEVFAMGGIFNGGFISVRQAETTERFLEWWSSRCRSKCQVNVRGGVFVDQLWLNFAPTFFPRCVATRHPGINVAYWNLHERAIEYDGEQAFVNGRPLIFLHFSGFDQRNDVELSRYQTRYRSTDFIALQRLVAEYKAVMQECGCGNTPAAYPFDKLSDGTRIRKIWREAVRTDVAELKLLEDPFAADGNMKLKHKLDRSSHRSALLREDWTANGVRAFVLLITKLPIVRRLWSRWIEYKSQ